MHTCVVLFQFHLICTSEIANITLKPIPLMHCSDVLLQVCLRLHLVVTIFTLVNYSFMLGFLVFYKVMVLSHRMVTLVAFVSDTVMLVFLMNSDISL